MRHFWMAAAVAGSAACAFPGIDSGSTRDGSWNGSSGSTYDSGGTYSGGSGDTSSAWDPPVDSTFYLSAYQATGLRDGQEVTISRGSVDFTAYSGDMVIDGDCWAVRAQPGQPLFPAVDVGRIHIAGGKAPYTCRLAGQQYDCDLPENEAFFEPGAFLSLQLEGNERMPRMTFGGIVPPRAPMPQGDLRRLFQATDPVEIRWAPSNENTEMTCLNLESLDDAGNVTAFAQCDVQDSEGHTTVPPTVMMMLDRNAPVMRATLYSANSAGTANAFATFGSGRFVEVRR